MKIANQTTVFIELGPDGEYIEVLTLNGASIVPDGGDSLMIRGTRIVINGSEYLMSGSGVQIISGEEGATIVTSVLVSKQ